MFLKDDNIKSAMFYNIKEYIFFTNISLYRSLPQMFTEVS